MGQAVKELHGLEMDLDGAAFEIKYETARKLLQDIEELPTYCGAESGLRSQLRGALPQRGKDRFRLRRISGQSSHKQADGEAAVNGWSQRGAHLLLQIRTRVLDEEWENMFRSWYPAFRPMIEAEVKNSA